MPKFTGTQTRLRHCPPRSPPCPTFALPYPLRTIGSNPPLPHSPPLAMLQNGFWSSLFARHLVPNAWPSGLLIYSRVAALQVKLEITLRGPGSLALPRATTLVVTSLLPPALLQTKDVPTLGNALHVTVSLLLIVVFDLSNLCGALRRAVPKTTAIKALHRLATVFAATLCTVAIAFRTLPR